MPATLTRTHKPAAQPRHGVCRWVRRPDARGFGGVLLIDGVEYGVRVCASIRRAYLSREARYCYCVHLDTGACVREDFDRDVTECCPDQHFRGRECKHLQAIRAGLKALRPRGSCCHGKGCERVECCEF